MKSLGLGRRCAFCKRAGGSAFVDSVLKNFGGEPGNGYAHSNCFYKAKRRAVLDRSTQQPTKGT